ncbi:MULTISPECIES: dihydrofolate reductase, partial [Clostridium]
MLSIVVAIGKNNVIGKDHSLPWHLPNDLKYFKKVTLTESKTMIMGRKTFQSLKALLPGRKHIILTKNKNFNMKDSNVEIINKIDMLKPIINDKKEYFVIGGGEIFSLLLPYTEKIYMTKIHHNFIGDTFFPNINRYDWNTTKEIQGITDEKNVYNHTFLILNRINNKK